MNLEQNKTNRERDFVLQRMNLIIGYFENTNIFLKGNIYLAPKSLVIFIWYLYFSKYSVFYIIIH